jgi:maleamate amidohydrolase
MMTAPSVLEGLAARYLDDVERAALDVAGYRRSVQLPDRPALLVIDVTYGFCGPAGKTLGDAVQRYPLSSGESAWRAVPNVARLVAGARARGLPIVFTRPHRPTAQRLVGRWGDTNTRHLERPADSHDFVAEIGWLETDLVLEKDSPSAFFGTSLRAWLTTADCDGVVICGGTTSGCVRATAVDAFSHGLRTTVVSDACFDRVAVSHDVSLFDLGLKYASLLPTDQLLVELPNHHDLRAANADGGHEPGRSSTAGRTAVARTDGPQPGQNVSSTTSKKEKK